MAVELARRYAQPWHRTPGRRVVSPLRYRMSRHQLGHLSSAILAVFPAVAAAAGFEGEYKAPELALVLRLDGGHYSGEFRNGTDRFPVTAQDQSGGLTGTFAANDHLQTTENVEGDAKIRQRSGVPHADPADPPRRRGLSRKGHGTFGNDGPRSWAWSAGKPATCGLRCWATARRPNCCRASGPAAGRAPRCTPTSGTPTPRCPSRPAARHGLPQRAAARRPRVRPGWATGTAFARCTATRWRDLGRAAELPAPVPRH